MPRAALVLLAFLLLAAPAAAGPGGADPRFGDGGLVSGPYGSGGDALAVGPGERPVLLDTRPGAVIVRRYTRSGRPDRRFAGGGATRVNLPDIHSGGWLHAGADGSVTAATHAARDRSSGWDLVRLRADGSLDRGFGGDGVVSVDAPQRSTLGGVAFQPDGAAVLVGTLYDERQEAFAFRLRPDGSPDAAFGFWRSGRGDPGIAGHAAVLVNGRILISGTSGDYGSTAPRSERVWALTPDGRLDAAWGDGGRFTGPLSSSAGPLVPAPDGGVVVLDALPAVYQAALRLGPDGRRAERWGLEGRIELPLYAQAAAFDGRGRLLVAGTGGWRARVVRIDADGRRDDSFGVRGVATPPLPPKATRSTLVGLASLQDESILGGGYSMTGYPDIREDYGRPRGLLVRLSGWETVFYRGIRNRILPGRRVLQLRAWSPRRVRMDVRVTQGRRVLFSRRMSLPVEGSRIRLRRRVRPFSPVTVTIRGRDSRGRPDSLRLRLRAPRR